MRNLRYVSLPLVSLGKAYATELDGPDIGGVVTSLAGDAGSSASNLDGSIWIPHALQYKDGGLTANAASPLATVLSILEVRGQRDQGQKAQNGQRVGKHGKHGHTMLATHQGVCPPEYEALNKCLGTLQNAK